MDEQPKESIQINGLRMPEIEQLNNGLGNRPNISFERMEGLVSLVINSVL